MTAAKSAGSRRERGPQLLQNRFAERLRELLPAGQMTLSRSVLGCDAISTTGESAGRLTWTSKERAVEFETWIELTPSLAKLQTLPQCDLDARLVSVPVLLAPHLALRSCLWLERIGWSYFTTSGAVLIQCHEPFIVIRVTSARPVLGNHRARPALERRIADPRGR